MSLPLDLDLGRCPHCGVDTPLLKRVRDPFDTASSDGEKQRRWGIYACSRCGGVLLAGFDRRSGDAEIYPDSEHSKIDDELPEAAKRYLAQAIDSCVRAPDGAVVLAAAAVDAMLKAKQLTVGSLYARIDEAATKHLITDEMAAWAHEVRLDANDQRHADGQVSHATTEDAQRGVDFVLALGEYFFVLPARIKRGHAAVEEAKRKAEERAKKAKPSA
jgi:hypothetical protein